MWNRDTPSSVTNQNLYGSHPFYMSVAADGSSHGVLLLNSNGMDVTLNSDYITYQVIGGVLDFYFFTGPLPEDVVRQYANFVGLPHMQPFWAFGFHQSAYGMPSIDYVEQVVANYSAANIPLDTIWCVVRDRRLCGLFASYMCVRCYRKRGECLTHSP